MTIERIEVGRLVSQAVVHGGLVYVSGQVDTREVREPTVADQTREILSRIDRLLERAGTSKHGLLSANVWLASMDTFSEMNAVWREWIPAGAPPARATVEARLALPVYLVEISVVAAINPSPCSQEHTQGVPS
jgi:enamine deaminase RidA (YjgF/YER057c/UK114 family)